MKNLKDILEHLKNKYDEVKIYKRVKKNIFVYVVFETKKNNRRYYYLAVLDKKNNIYLNSNKKESFTRVAKKDITTRINNAIKYINEVKTKQRLDFITKNENALVRVSLNNRIFKKSKKHKNSERFKNEKEFADWSFIWAILRFCLIHIDEEKKLFNVEQNKDTGLLNVTIKENANPDEIEKLIYKIYIRLSKQFRDNNILADTLKGELVEVEFERNYKQVANKIKTKMKGKSFMYLDTMFIFYLVQLWQEQVENKTLDTIVLFGADTLQMMYDKVNELVDISLAGTDKNITEEVVDNAVFFGDLWFNENYRKFIKIGV